MRKTTRSNFFNNDTDADADADAGGCLAPDTNMEVILTLVSLSMIAYKHMIGKRHIVSVRRGWSVL